MQITESINFVNAGFTGALATLASAYADVAFASGAAIPGGPSNCFLSSIRLLSAQNLKFKVEFWGRSLPVATSPQTPETWVPTYKQEFLQSDATPYGTWFAYYATGLKVPYIDYSGSGSMHINLVNNDGTAKSAGSAGFVHISVGTISCV